MRTECKCYYQCGCTGEQDTLDELIEEMVQHTIEYPTHGHNCHCKDDIIRRIRLRLKEIDPVLAAREFGYAGDLIRRHP